MLTMAMVPVVAMEMQTSAAAMNALAASTVRGGNLLQDAEPTNRPTIAPPQ